MSSKQIFRYPNLFAELGYPPAKIQARTEEIFNTLFYGGEGVQLYHPVEPDMACFEDRRHELRHDDVRTDGPAGGI